MRNLTAVVLVLISLNAFVFADDKEGNESSEPPHSSEEIAWNVGIGVASAATGGVSAAGGNIPGAIVGVANGAKNFLDAAKNIMKMFNTNVIEMMTAMIEKKGEMIMILGIMNIKIYDYKEIYL